MSIVPVYRLRATPADEHRPGGLRATPADEHRRYRFSRDPTPASNPHPGQKDEDPDTKWIVDGIAFYAWSDQVETDDGRAELRPVYEFHRCQASRHQYYYSLDPAAKPTWKKRPYVAFWAHAEDVEIGAPPVYRYSQEDVKRSNYALGVDGDVEGWRQEPDPVFFASERVPVRVSVRPHWKNAEEYDWTFEPSTVNLAYGSMLEFEPAPNSNFSFTEFQVVGGEQDFDQPHVTPEKVLLKARCSDRGKDYKYNVTVRIDSTQQEIFGDPEIVNQTPFKL